MGSALSIEEIIEELRPVCPGCEGPAVENGDRFIVVPARDSRAVCERLRDDAILDFDSLMCLAGHDDGEFLQVNYFLHSMAHTHKVQIKVLLPREEAKIESVEDIWKVANYFEREAYDLYGIVFRGHPDLRRILNPDDWQGWPMRKDYVQPETYHGIALDREEQFFDD